MKKKLATSLATVMLLSAYGGPTSGRESSSTSSSGQTNASISDAAPAQSANGSVVQFDPSATIEETLLVDESDVKTSATEIKYTVYDVKLSLVIENNGSQDLSFYSGTLGYNCNSVNGYMVDDGNLNASIQLL